MGKAHDKQEIACQQVLVADSSVFSIQWSILPTAVAAGITPGLLLERYLSYIRRATLSIITPVRTGTGLEFRLLKSNLSLISFLPPETATESITLRICGGLLVQPHQCHRGELCFALEPAVDGTRISLQLSDYCPLLLGSSTPSAVRRWLYRLTQAAIHRLVTIRFLTLLYRDLAGSPAAVRVIKARVRDGRPV